MLENMGTGAWVKVIYSRRAIFCIVSATYWGSCLVKSCSGGSNALIILSTQPGRLRIPKP